MEKHLKQVDHGYIRYANCWEDADLLLKGLEIKKGDNVLSIGSAGDNSFSLLTGDPKLVVAVDINRVQLNLIELKKAAFKGLEYEEFLAFLGFIDSDDRLSLFRKVAMHLDTDVKRFWAIRYEEIEAGVIYQGKFEKYFGMFKDRVLPFVHNKKKVDGLFAPKDDALQSRFFTKKWNSVKWRALFKLFFSKFIMGRLGRDPKFLEEVDVSVSDFILNQAKDHLTSKECQKNYFLDFILRGKFQIALPHYAREENFENIKNNVDKLEIFEGYASDAFLKYQGFNKFNLSNIFEYMNIETFENVVSDLVQAGVKGAKYAYWNLMVPRNMNEVHTKLKQLDLGTYHDNGFFYSNFHINQK